MSVSFDHNWSTISLEYFDYEDAINFDSNGLNFNSDFNINDKGQFPIEQKVIGEAEFAIDLRAQRIEGEFAPLQNFYNKCKQHFADEFTVLLDGCISNANCIKALTEFEDSNRLMKFFKLDLSSEINFGKAQCLQDSAMKFNAQVKADLMTLSKKLQTDTLEARKEALSEAVEQLSTCSDRFMSFGRDEWVRQCQNAGSSVNVLDQLYAVSRDDENDTVDAEPADRNELSTEMEQDEPSVFKMSTFLYALAIHDSKIKVNEHIRDKRIEEERAKKRAAAIREKQTQVDVSATAAKPTDTFRNRFENIDKRLANVEKAVPVQQPRHAKLAMNAAEPDTSTSDSVQTKTLLETMVQLERSVSDLRMSCLTVASEMTSPAAKNASGPATTELSKKAQKRKRKEEAAERAARTAALASVQTNAQTATQTTAIAANQTQNAGPTTSTGGRGKNPRIHSHSQQPQQPPHVNGGRGNAHAGKPASADNTPPQAGRGGAGRGFTLGRGPTRE